MIRKFCKKDKKEISTNGNIYNPKVIFIYINIEFRKKTICVACLDFVTV